MSSRAPAFERRALLLTIAALAWAPRAEARGLGDDEQRRLREGGLVHRDVDYDSGDGSYFGGVAYAVVEASAADVMRAIVDANAYRSILPLTLEAREVARTGDVSFVFLRQGTRLGTAAYTLMVRRESEATVRFWLDTSRPHEIEDCWGYFHVDAIGPGKSLVTYAALVRLEVGMVRLLFKEKIRSYALQTPLYVRRYVMSLAKP